MSKFINTHHKTTIDSLVGGLQERLKNPYYFFNDKKPTVVNYYNINKKMSTLDEASRLSYSQLGHNSPLKYNYIEDMFLFGMGRIEVNLNSDEWGVEADSIEGEAIILPNTIIPYPDDYFVIPYTKEDIMYRVTNVSMDTLEDGANIYKINYKLDQIDHRGIDKQVVERFRMIVNNVGTEYSAIIRSADYDVVDKLQNVTLTLKKYYKELFYNNRVQTFTFKNYDVYFYDPYMIEFMLRNKIMSGDDEYTYVSHQLSLPRTFSIDYDRSIFRNVELGKKEKVRDIDISFIGDYISDPNSLMSTRLEKYFSVRYRMILPEFYVDTARLYGLNNVMEFDIRMNCIEPELKDKIITNSYYEPDDKLAIYNFLIAYYNKKDITVDMIDMLDNITYLPTITLFYAIPMTIFVIEYYIKKLLR